MTHRPSACSRASGVGRTVISDIEANGLLREVSKIHCIVAIDVRTRELFSWRPWEILDALAFLEECELVIGHNFIDYDARAIEKLHPGWKRPKILDTLILAKLIWPYDILYGPDMARITKGTMPAKLLKSHSLKAWGYRLGNFKGEYDGGWDVWCEEMHSYMEQDGWVCLDLYLLCLRRLGWLDPKPGDYVWPTLPVELEHEVAVIIRREEEVGFDFDREAAIRLSQDLMNAKAELEQKLVDHFGSWWAPLDDPIRGKRPAKATKRKRTEFPDVTTPRFGKGGKPLAPYVGPPVEDYDPEAPFVRIERVTFSPSSRDHLGQRLQAVYGWKPKKYGTNGKPTVDETTLEEIPESILPADLRRTLLDFFVVNKTLGQLSAGNKAWLRLIDEEDGRLHGRMDTQRAITGRGAHMDPNKAQVPAVSKDKVTKEPKLGVAGGFGWECRSLFKATEGRQQTGTDASSLELLCLGHYLEPLDGGVFSERVSDPNRDPHAEHAEMIGEARDDTKTTTYAYVYGAGPGKVGTTLSLDPSEVPDLLRYGPLKGILAWKKRCEGADYVEPDETGKARLAKGHRVIKAFEEKIPGLKDLKDSVMAMAAARGWLKGLDGRKLYVRKPHAALNTLLQGAGAIICKLWMTLVHEELAARGLSSFAYRKVFDELNYLEIILGGPLDGETA